MGHYSEGYEYEKFQDRLLATRRYREVKLLIEGARQAVGYQTKFEKVVDKLVEAMFWLDQLTTKVTKEECEGYGYDYDTLERKKE